MEMMISFSQRIDNEISARGNCQRSAPSCVDALSPIRTLTFAKEGCLGDTTSKQSRLNKRNLDKLLWGRKKLQKVVHSARAKVLQGTMKKCWNNLEDSMGRQFGHPWLRLQAAFARVPKIDWNKESDTSILKSLPCVGWFLRIAWDMLASHSLYKYFFQEGSTSRAEKQNSIDANREMWTAEKGKDLQLEMWLSELLLSKSFDLKNLRYWLYMREILRKKSKGSQFTRFLQVLHTRSHVWDWDYGITKSGSDARLKVLAKIEIEAGLGWDLQLSKRMTTCISKSWSTRGVHRIIESQAKLIDVIFSISNVELKATCFLAPDILCFFKRQSLATSCAFAVMMRPKRYTIGIE